MKNNFSSPGFLWPLLAVICLAIIIFGLGKALGKTPWTVKRRVTVFCGISLPIVLWIIMLTVLSYKNFFTDFSKLPPRLLFALFIPLPVVLAFSFSRTATKLLEKVPAQWLIFMQSFRIFVEILIWFAFLANKLPRQMSFEGRNFDVLTGLLAIPVGMMLLSKKTWSSKMVLGYNILGMALLLNILVVSFLSMPTPFRYFMDEPSNVLLAQFPFILLPGLLVPMAYTLHILSLRQLFLGKNSKTINVAGLALT